MRTMTYLMIVAASLVITAATGCNAGGSRMDNAAVRWENTMDQVRVEAARESLAQGRYDYARKVLEPCVTPERQGQRHDERIRRDAELLMAQIQAADHMYAQLDTFRLESDRERTY